MAPFEGPSYEPEQENPTWWEWVPNREGQSGGDYLTAQYKKLM